MVQPQPPPDIEVIVKLHCIRLVTYVPKLAAVTDHELQGVRIEKRGVRERQHQTWQCGWFYSLPLSPPLFIDHCRYAKARGCKRGVGDEDAAAGVVHMNPDAGGPVAFFGAT